MIDWKGFEAAEFRAAKERGLPILLFVTPEGTHRRSDAVPEALSGSEGRLVAMRVDKADRPDIHARYAESGEVLLLDHDAQVLESAALAALPAKLAGWLASFSPKSPARAAEPHAHAWTGAVGGPARPAVVPERPREVVRALLGAQALPLPGVELLLHAAAEWGDAASRARAEAELAGWSKRLENSELDLYERAWTLRLLWDAHAAFGGEPLRRAAAKASAALVEELFDAKAGAFRHAPGAGAPIYADENALAALALQRASVFEPSARFGQTAEQVLAFLQGSAYDPMLGMIHRRRDDGALVYGLLGDAAWTILAFTEAFALTGHKPHREFADNLARFLFQELWDRDGGGFLDRVPQQSDAGLLRRPRLARPEENAAALEGLWRLHHLKGNTNYRRWLEWALARLSASQDPAAAGIARVQDLLQRGRLDLELIGRPGGEGVDALIAAAHRHYAPRRILSFVDPDDQDYILAHRLDTPGQPRLFGCVDLKPVASAALPAEVAAVMKALS